MKVAKNGYTLIELMVTMLIFSVVMVLISVSFSRIVRSSSVLNKSVETDTGGLIGLELLRTDLELAGFGLPWSIGAGVSYREAEVGSQLVDGCDDGCPRAEADRYNDYPKLDAPTAYRVGDNVGLNGSDYLVLKGSALGTSRVSRSWCYLSYSSVARPSRTEPGPEKGDRVIVLKTGTLAGSPTRELVSSGTSYSLTFDDLLPPEFTPRERHDSHLIYGIAPQDGVALAFPFNRADYYISRPGSISPVCNRHTGVLYKTTMNHSSPRSYSYYPILDCAADLQVVFYIDSDGDGKIDYHPDAGEEPYSAELLREKLKEIRVYVLAQQGKMDPSYLYPVADPAEAILVGDAELDHHLGRVWSASAMEASFGAEWRNYRWKLYSIVVQPKNL